MCKQRQYCEPLWTDKLVHLKYFPRFWSRASRSFVRMHEAQKDKQFVNVSQISRFFTCLSGRSDSAKVCSFATILRENVFDALHKFASQNNTEYFRGQPFLPLLLM